MTPDSRTVVELWMMFRGGLGGFGPLPFRGGYAEQPAALIAGFQACSGVEAALRPKRP